MMTNKEKYKILCASEPSIPIYSRDWWLDCVCGENCWDALLYCPKEEIEAAMPFYMPHKGIICMPPFTQTHGIWFNPAFEDKHYSKNLYRKQTICDYFIKCLPEYQYFHQNFHYSFTDWLPFYWQGFQQTTRYNYVLFNIADCKILWNNLSGDIRRNIQKAQNKFKLEVRRDVSLKQFIDINTNTYKRQGKKTYCPDMLKKIIETAQMRKQGDIWGAYDEKKCLHAAIFIVWQDNCAYLIASGGDPELRKSGGNALVVWTAINDLSRQVTSFDFEGSMTKGVEHFFRGFGAIQMPYFTLSKGKTGLWKKFMIKIKQQWRKAK